MVLNLAGLLTMWLSGDLLGPQRNCPQEPIKPARLHAQWRQAEVENREAIEVRKQWMRVLGMDEEEISEDVAKCFDLDLAAELGQLSYAIELAGIRCRRACYLPDEQNERLPF